MAQINHYDDTWTRHPILLPTNLQYLLSHLPCPVPTITPRSTLTSLITPLPELASQEAPHECAWHYLFTLLCHSFDPAVNVLDPLKETKLCLSTNELEELVTVQGQSMRRDEALYGLLTAMQPHLCLRSKRTLLIYAHCLLYLDRAQEAVTCLTQPEPEMDPFSLSTHLDSTWLDQYFTLFSYFLTAQCYEHLKMQTDALTCYRSIEHLLGHCSVPSWLDWSIVKHSTQRALFCCARIKVGLGLGLEAGITLRYCLSRECQWDGLDPVTKVWPSEAKTNPLLLSNALLVFKTCLAYLQVLEKAFRKQTYHDLFEEDFSQVTSRDRLVLFSPMHVHEDILLTLMIADQVLMQCQPVMAHNMYCSILEKFQKKMKRVVSRLGAFQVLVKFQKSLFQRQSANDEMYKTLILALLSAHCADEAYLAVKAAQSNAEEERNKPFDYLRDMIERVRLESVSQSETNSSPLWQASLLVLKYKEQNDALPKALKLYEEARQRDPENDRIAYNLAICFALMGKVKEALQMCRFSLKLNDANVHKWHLMALLLYVENPDELEAPIRLLRFALSREETPRRFHVWMTLCLLEALNQKKAEKEQETPALTTLHAMFAMWGVTVPKVGFQMESNETDPKKETSSFLPTEQPKLMAPVHRTASVKATKRSTKDKLKEKAKETKLKSKKDEINTENVIFQAATSTPCATSLLLYDAWQGNVYGMQESEPNDLMSEMWLCAARVYLILALNSALPGEKTTFNDEEKTLLESAKEACQEAKLCQAKHSLGRVYEMMGLIAESQGQSEQAQSYYEESLFRSSFVPLCDSFCGLARLSFSKSGHSWREWIHLGQVATQYSDAQVWYWLGRLSEREWEKNAVKQKALLDDAADAYSRVVALNVFVRPLSLCVPLFL